MASEGHTTTNHEEIKKWVEKRGGKPASVASTGGGGDPGILRIDFPGHGDDSDLDHISWDEFFKKFEANKLAFLYQDKTAHGETSRFFKFVRR